MKFSYNWLQKFFTESLPSPEDLAEKITFHSSEIEEIISLTNDSVLDVKVLPDKSAWLMSHRGLAKDISVMLDIKMKDDPFYKKFEAVKSDEISISLNSSACSYYAAALVKGVQIKPSPDWLREAIEAIGQRSINNIVDATNYVMFELGQPLHAFDANKLKVVDGKYCLGVRQANPEEKIVVLTGETFELSQQDTIIIDANDDQPIGIAGIKGGRHAAIDENTTDILIESANFNRVAVRNTAKRIKLQTDASKRFENGIAVPVAPIALNRVVEVILEIAGSDYLGQVSSGNANVMRHSVSTSLAKINSVLGLNLTKEDVSSIINRFGFSYEWEGEMITVVPTFERDDLVIAEDLIEEIGRMHGLEHIVSIAPKEQVVSEFNKRHYYAEKIRQSLVGLGFSEIYTSSFRSKDIVKLENALASDKEYLRSTLIDNIKEAVDRNIPHRDLLGLSAIKLFEIGTVFNEDYEEFRVALAVQTGTVYKAKTDKPLLEEALGDIANVLELSPEFLYEMDGVVEFSLDSLLSKLPNPDSYDPVKEILPMKYQAFSVYPAMSRDIAMWVEQGINVDEIIATIKGAGGPLLYRITQFDEFTKDSKTSYAFRIVFQSFEKTLTDEEVQIFMDNIYKSVANKGWEVR